MTNKIEKESILRQLTSNPATRKIAEKALTIEDEEEARRQDDQSLYPWLGFEWTDIPAPIQTLNQLVIDGLLVTGGPRGTYKSRSTTAYKLKDPELVRECLIKITEIKNGAEDGDIPDDLFDFILGHDALKDLLRRSLNSDKPVHVLMVGPPATAKSMFLGELARLPFSRYALGGGTRKAGLEDYLLEFRPRYLIIDEIDKMDMREMSVLLSLMESGVVARLKRRMREVEKMTTWVFAGANRDKNIWPELKSRFFTIYLEEYSEDEFISIAKSVPISREKVNPSMAEFIACTLAKYTCDIRDAIQFGRLVETESDLNNLLKLRWPARNAENDINNPGRRRNHDLTC